MQPAAMEENEATSSDDEGPPPLISESESSEDSSSEDDEDCGEDETSSAEEESAAFGAGRYPTRRRVRDQKYGQTLRNRRAAERLFHFSARNLAKGEVAA